MRKAIEFLGANLFLLAMLAAGAAVVIVLARAAQLAGADAELMGWLYWPIGMAGIAACYFAGRLGHKALTRII